MNIHFEILFQRQNNIRIHLARTKSLPFSLPFQKDCLSLQQKELHVHVIHGTNESIFDIIIMNGELQGLHVREKKGAEPLTDKDKRTAESFIRKYYKNIIDKWVKFFVLKQSVRSTNIKKKI